MPINITMPALSPTMESGTLAKWLVKEGDSIEAGDVIAEIETDKATMEVEAVDEGILAKILVSEGSENVPVNDIIAILAEDDEDPNELVLDEKISDALTAQKTSQEKPNQAREANLDPVSIPEQITKKDNSAISSQSNKAHGTQRVFASPLAKRLAKQNNMDISNLKGSGPNGRIVKDDIEKAMQSGIASSTSSSTNQFGAFSSAMPSSEPTHIPNNTIKKITAKRLLESKTTVPHFYLTIDCNLDLLLEARKEINEKAQGEYKISVNDFIIKANAMALMAYPAANVSWSEEALIQYHQSDISVAVATPNGLITPIVRNAQSKGLREISAEVKELAQKAKENKLKPEEFQGGSFTISNLGMYGIKEFSAIINPPQSCILAVGAGEKRPVAEGNEIKIANIMTCTLSTDHRSVDGAVGAEYLQVFKRYIENPVMMLV